MVFDGATPVVGGENYQLNNLKSQHWANDSILDELGWFTKKKLMMMKVIHFS